MGILFVFMFIFRFYVSKSLVTEEDETYWLISNAILVIIATQLLRQGNYTYNGFIMFVWMYYFNRISYNSYVEAKHEKEAANEAEQQEIELAKLN